MDNTEALEILKHNKGFDNPNDWIEYAQSHSFKKIKAQIRYVCPDCGNNILKTIGQYVYYSQLIRMKKCKKCFLTFSNVIIDKEVIVKHFEMAYKDVKYFEFIRYPIFNHITHILSRSYPDKLKILDVGGATGQLSSMLLEKNDKYNIIVNDISQIACNTVIKEHKIRAICCNLSDLYNHELNVDVLLLVDILYYVEDIKMAWYSINKCLNEDGILIMRIPNKLLIIEIIQFLIKIFTNNYKAEKVYGLCYEHIYFFNNSYLNRKLIELGFKQISYFPSPMKNSKNALVNLILKLIYVLSIFVYYITFKHVCLTPSKIVKAHKTRPR